MCTYRFLKKKKKVECGNGIAKIGGEIFLRNDMFTQFLQYFYNKFKWKVVIIGLKK